jgi:hypothetical protein
MNLTQENLEGLIAKVEARERLARKRAIAYTVIPILLAGILLWFTSVRVIHARQEVARYQKSINEYVKRVSELEERLRQSTSYVEHIVQLDWSNVKYLHSRYPRQAELLERIIMLKEREVKWKLGGSSPEEGFDSPSFAAYLLDRVGLLRIPFSERYRLRELISPTSEPEVGDLIFYDTGYTMFYFKDRRGEPFCVGMTPAGIVALEIRFGPRLLGYGKMDYSRMRRGIFE